MWEQRLEYQPLAPAIGRHFVAAEIRAFRYAEFEQAKAWVAGG